MNNEIWRDIDGYSNYQVSNLGRVKSLDYRKTGKEQILKLINNKDGYLEINLSKNGKSKRYLVHRLVAQAFIPNPECKPCIDHISGERFLNTYSNLRWVIHKENSNNPISLVKMSGKYGKLHPNSKPINQLSLNGDFIKMWDCARDIERELGYNPSGISQCCNGKRNTANGYKWCFAS